MATPSGRRSYVSDPRDVLRPFVRAAYVGVERLPAGSRSESPSPLRTLALAGTRSGTATLVGPDFRATHAPGSIMVMVPQPGFHETAGPGAWDTHWMVVEGPLADSWLRDVVMSPPSAAIPEAPAREAQALFDACCLMLEPRPDWQWQWLADVALVLAFVRREIAARDSGALSLAARARWLMERHVDDPLSLDEIARRLGVSTSNLAHEFRRETGVPPMRAYRDVRVRRARELLAAGMTVTRVSDLLGFANPYHFSRLFAKATGSPPSLCRGERAPLRIRKG